MVARIAKLVPPQMDKHHSFQIVNRNAEDLSIIRQAIQLPEVKVTQPFIQGCDDSWIMVEFWSRDKSKVKPAADAIAKALNITYTEGDFTRAELGLE
jgi:hypothetical protein